jgi:hypothetical protein
MIQGLEVSSGIRVSGSRCRTRRLGDSGSVKSSVCLGVAGDSEGMVSDTVTVSQWTRRRPRLQQGWPGPARAEAPRPLGSNDSESSPLRLSRSLSGIASSQSLSANHCLSHGRQAPGPLAVSVTVEAALGGGCRSVVLAAVSVRPRCHGHRDGCSCHGCSCQCHRDCHGVRLKLPVCCSCRAAWPAGRGQPRKRSRHPMTW